MLFGADLEGNNSLVSHGHGRSLQTQRMSWMIRPSVGRPCAGMQSDTHAVSQWRASDKAHPEADRANNFTEEVCQEFRLAEECPNSVSRLPVREITSGMLGQGAVLRDLLVWNNVLGTPTSSVGVLSNWVNSRNVFGVSKVFD